LFALVKVIAARKLSGAPAPQRVHRQTPASET
jgi:hypothetical protein